MPSAVGVLLIVIILALLDPRVAAADTNIPVSLPQALALGLQAQLAGLHPAEVLQTLGIEDTATLTTALPVRMRDGVDLAATVIVPRDRTGKRFPVILIRSPYKLSDELSSPLARQLIPILVRDDYIIVIVNDRGTQWSQGEYHWLRGANRDGYDILEWITHQAWSDGSIGAFGCSSSAESQPGMATLNHPALKAFVEMAGATALGSVPGFHDQGIFYNGGVPSLGWAFWYRSFGHVHHPQLPANLPATERVRVASSYSPEPNYAIGDIESLVSHLPSEDILRAAGTPETEWDRLIHLAPASHEWADYDFIQAGDRTRIPGLHVDSWYDVLEAYPTTKLYQALTLTSPNQYLVMGPTAHCLMGSETEHTSVGDRTVGDARFDYVGLIKGWYDHWLKGVTPWADVPPVQYYVLNSNRWLTAPAWPPPGGSRVRLLLASRGHANGLNGDGRLVSERGSHPTGNDAFTDDPTHPVPSLGGCCSDAVSREQSGVEARDDVLVYTSEPYDDTVRIVGDVNVSLALISTASDTDIMVKLVDVYPDGSAYNLSDTALRVRYRDGVEHATLMSPGHVYRAILQGMVTATDMLPGHRLRIEIAGTNFPSYERNLHSGSSNHDESQPRAARTRILHDALHPSSVEFNVLSSSAVGLKLR